MSWNKEKINNHIEAARRLDKIIADTFKFIGNRTKGSDLNPTKVRPPTEWDVQQFILKEFKKHKIKNEVFTPIVAFGPNTSHVHYHPSQYSIRLKPGMLILIDIWGRLNQKNAPYADMTWMAFYGRKVPAEVQKVFNL